MNAATMSYTQQSGPVSTATWRVAPGQAMRLPPVRRARWLRVLDGELWLTFDGRPGEPPDDCWLGAGTLTPLPAGREVVLEGHPAAAFQLLEPAPVSGASRSQAWRAWWRRLWQPPAGRPCQA